VQGTFLGQKFQLLAILILVVLIINECRGILSSLMSPVQFVTSQVLSSVAYVCSKVSGKQTVASSLQKYQLNQAQTSSAKTSRIQKIK